MEAADRQMHHIRRHQVGQYAEYSQKLLNEIATAKLCLLDPSRKERTIDNSSTAKHCASATADYTARRHVSGPGPAELASQLYYHDVPKVRSLLSLVGYPRTRSDLQITTGCWVWSHF